MVTKITKQKKLNVAILGSGNIGSDLLIKINRSRLLECSMFIGQNPDSINIKRAEELGIPVRINSIQAIIDEPGKVDLVFDATSAAAHRVHAPILRKLKKFVIDLTPSKIGLMCVPLINLEEGLSQLNVNMISCGGQATTPIVKALMEIHPETEYVELISSVSSSSAGIGTRNNIDEYTQTTSEGIMKLTEVKKAKTIIILNPADPPINMHNTIYAKIKNPNMEMLKKNIHDVVNKIKKYVPGFQLTVEPVFENNRVTIMTEVIGRGDFLPTYAGNLDIINSAAIEVAEKFATKKLGKY